MSDERAVSIEALPTGVPGLDEVLGGGIPEYSFNLIAGDPGSGKTTLAHQVIFANATPERRALYFTVLGEPVIKMLRYQQQFSFFDPDMLGEAIRFVNLSEEVLEQDLDRVLERIVDEVEEFMPGIVVVDSFRTVVRAAETAGAAEVRLQDFVQRLALHLTSWEVTSFLVGEYSAAERQNNPIFTVADGILWLHQAVQGNSIVRKLQVVKLRGHAPLAGLHAFRITDDGLRVFPRIGERPRPEVKKRPRERISTGVPGLDDMMRGGIPAGDAVLLAGPSGSGKTILAMQMVVEGLRRDEPAVVAMFEEHPEEYLARASVFGLDLEEEIRRDALRVIRLRPLDLSVDEVLETIEASVREIGAHRVVIDSVSGFEIGLAPTFRAEIRDSLYRLVARLTGIGVTVLMTLEVVESFSPPRFTRHGVSFLADDIVVQRFVELNGFIRNVISVVKMRRSEHSRALRLYEITPRGVAVGEILRGYQGVVSGAPALRGSPARPAFPGLTGEESIVLESLIEQGAADVERLTRETGLNEGELRPIMERLVELDYVERREEADEVRYRHRAPPPDA
ncbi:MAG: RAD55 family ATPase [Gemmatimonadota bacterium]